MPWGRWEQVPGGTFRQPQPISSVGIPGAVAAYAVGEDGRVYNSNKSSFPQPPEPWMPLPGGLFFLNPASPVAVVSSNPVWNDVFVIGEDHRVHTAWAHHAPWQGWNPVLGEVFPEGVVTPLAAVSRNPGFIDLFAVGMDGHVRSAYFHNAPWQGWIDIGEESFPVGTPVTAISANPSWIDLFAVTKSGRVWTTFFHNAPWVKWRPVLDKTFPPLTALGAVSRNPGFIDLFAVDEGGTVYTAWSHSAPWEGWNPVPGAHFQPGAPVTAISSNPSWIDLVAVGADGGIRTTSFHDAPWQPWTLAQPAAPFVLFPAGTNVAAASPFPEEFAAYAIGNDGHAYWNESAPPPIAPPPTPPTPPPHHPPPVSSPVATLTYTADTGGDNVVLQSGSWTLTGPHGTAPSIPIPVTGIASFTHPGSPSSMTGPEAWHARCDVLVQIYPIGTDPSGSTPFSATLDFTWPIGSPIRVTATLVHTPASKGESAHDTFNISPG